jgi:hypothetical protein
MVASLAAGCAARRQPVVVDAGITAIPPEASVQAAPPPSDSAPASAATDESATSVTPVAVPTPAPPPAEASLHDLCRQESDSPSFVDESRRVLAETFCGATLWFDGLFGGTPDVRNARAVSGRVELSGLRTDFEGFDGKARLRLNYELPNLQRRVRFFLGRDERSFTSDRQEGFAIRSAVFGLDDRDEWLAGLGYRPPGRFLQRVDFGVGARLKSSPEVFAQTRYRRNVFLGRNDVWRFRETVFWENRDGFGSTTSLDWDRVLRRDLLLRWGNVGTISEASDGFEWRSAMVLYKNLRGLRAIAEELFARGATDAEVSFREIGARTIYRQPLRAPYLFGDLIVGYSWPRERRYQAREGSAMIGLGVELLFGHEPY